MIPNDNPIAVPHLTEYSRYDHTDSWLLEQTRLQSGDQIIEKSTV